MGEKRIQNIIELIRNQDFVTLEDMDYLARFAEIQAERMQVYEEAEDWINEFEQSFELLKNTMEENEKLESQNKRYRDAIRSARDELGRQSGTSEIPTNITLEGAYVIYEILQKALEADEE